MASNKKDRQVGTIEHDSGVSIPLMFNPNDRGEHALTFNAAFADKKWIGPSADDVRKQVRDYLDVCSKLDWAPVIEIKETHPFAADRPEHFVGIELARYYLAVSQETRQNGKNVLRRLSWDDFADPSFGQEKGTSIDMQRIKRSREFHLFSCSDLKAALPHSEPHHDNHVFVIDHTEEMWAALQNIQDGIGRLKKMLRGLIGTSAGHEKLMAVGAQMLKMLPPIEK
jgi:hypothetical protein